jgi:hypothetical protein
MTARSVPPSTPPLRRGCSPRKAKEGDLPAAAKIKVIDTNGDGVLAAEEHAAGSRSMFAAMDTDKDGALSEAELSAGHAKMLRK